MGNSKLPINQFTWLDHDEIERLDVTNFDADGDFGLILEVDLLYPKHLHDKHKDYPMAADTLTVTEKMISPYAKEFLRKHKNSQKISPQTRLAPNLFDKHNYVVHIKNLQYYLIHGLKLVSVRRVIRFHQSTWLKKFIDFNINKRKESRTSFDIMLYKLMCNSVFGE